MAKSTELTVASFPITIEGMHILGLQSNALAIADDKMSLVAMFRPAEDDDHLHTQYEQARLMASAPQLYRVAKYLFSQVCDKNIDLSDNTFEDRWIDLCEYLDGEADQIAPPKLF